MDEDPELEELRRRKMRELEEQVDDQAVEQARQEQAQAKKKAVLRQVLTPEARERLERIRMARPERAESIQNQLIQLAASGRLQSKITDEQLKQVLAQTEQNRRDINIERR